MQSVILPASLFKEDMPAEDLIRQFLDAGLATVLIEDLEDGNLLHSLPKGLVSIQPSPADYSAGKMSQDLLERAIALSGHHPSEVCVICENLGDAVLAEALSAYPILVQGEQELDSLLGSADPANKALTIASDLNLAAQYAIEEAEHFRKIGPSPFSASPQDRRAESDRIAFRFGPSQNFRFDSWVAGMAVALGLAYLLQEVYQTTKFPQIFYYLTLQFIPQTLRGLLFLVHWGCTGFDDPAPYCSVCFRIGVPVGAIAEKEPEPGSALDIRHQDSGIATDSSEIRF